MLGRLPGTDDVAELRQFSVENLFAQGLDDSRTLLGANGNVDERVAATVEVARMVGTEPAK